MHDKIKGIADQMASWMEAEMAKGAHAADTQALMCAADIIKDLSEACYHASVSDAMEGYDGRMGYTPERDRSGRFKRAGYMEPPERGAGYEPKRMRHDERYDDSDGYDPRYGRPYNRWLAARRHYTETHSEADKKAMREHENEHLMDAVATFREMWEDADPDMRKRMKAELTRLTADMQA